MTAPLDRIDELLAPNVLSVVQRATAIPTIAGKAKAAAAQHPALVRADIGQIVGVDEALEVLYGPPVGIAALREAVAQHYNATFGLALAAQNVAITSGAAEALTVLFHCFGKGRRVGLPLGGWSNYKNGVALAGAEGVEIAFFDDAGTLDVEGVDRAIGEHDLAAVVANFPCNPTGAVLSSDEMGALAEVCVARDVVLIADEVYARLRYDGAPPQTMLSFAPGHAISVGSASKEFLLPGARVGYVVSTRPALTDRVLRKVVRANTASPNVLGQQRLVQLMEMPGLFDKICDEMHARRDALLDVLARHEMAPGGRTPGGTIFMMAALPPWWDGDDESFATRALAEGCFSCIPGSAFGLPGAVRFSFGAMTLSQIGGLDAQLNKLQGAIRSGQM